ncbi:MAG: STAS domain-containing protein [Pirellulaceae bacterium]|nr:STAS domain-containing protein [Pirellulaceae bacterium]
MSDSRYFQVDDRGDVLVLRLRPVHLDRSVASEFGADLLSLLDQHTARRVVVNLAEVTQISSLALAKMMAFDKRVSAAGGRVMICAAVPEVNQIISVAWPGRLSDEPASEESVIAELKAWQPREVG